MENRKKDHINLAFESRTGVPERDTRFYYEPLLNPHPSSWESPLTFLGKNFRVPLWVSGMTGGTALAKTINTNLARACRDFGFGMSLGSCRIILDNRHHLSDFDMRDVIGDDLPLFANLGISQVEQYVEKNDVSKITGLIKRLRADGLVIHINPLQEFLQPEGDTIKKAPLDTIRRFLDMTGMQVIVKEVGQGMGPESLRGLLKLPLAAVEFGAFGGTNFAKLELMRNEAFGQVFQPFSLVGEDALNMVDYVNRIAEEEGKNLHCGGIIISGGIKNFLDGYYLLNKINLPAVYGQASAFLEHARESYEKLYRFTESQVKGFSLAKAFLKVR